MQYKNPPIIETGLHIHFVSDQKPILNNIKDEIQSLYNNFTVTKKLYSDSNDVLTDEIQNSLEENFKGYLLEDVSSGKALTFTDASLGVHKYAPYVDWDDTHKDILSYWNIFRKNINAPHIEEITTRYINRIDIPNQNVVLASDYISIIQNSFTGSYNIAELNLNYTLDIDNDCRAAVIISNSEPPSEDFISYYVLIYIRMRNLEERDISLDEGLNNLRKQKNRIFEDIITEKARELFV